MNQRTMWISVVAAIAALAFAYRSAHAVEEKKGGPSSVTLLDTAADTVTTLAYRWDKGTTTTTLSGSKAGRRAVVVVDRELPPKKDPKDKKNDAADVVDAGVPDALVEPAAREQGTIPGGKGVLAAATALEPLTTKRTLGVVDDARLLAMGLSPPLRFLDVTTSTGKQLHLEIGEASYGAQGRYARVVGDSTVHLIDGAVINGLEGGLDALLEKRLLLAELDQIRGFDVVVGTGTEQRGSFLHVDKDQPSTRYWASRDAPTTKREAVGKLLTTLRNLRGSSLAGKDVVAGAVVVRFVVDVDGNPQQIDVLERADGGGQLAKVGDFTWTLSPTSGREIVEDATTALAE